MEEHNSKTANRDRIRTDGGILSRFSEGSEDDAQAQEEAVEADVLPEEEDGANVDLEEVVRRLQSKDKKITHEAIKEERELIKEQQQERTKHTGAINNSEDRSNLERRHVAPEKIVRNGDHLTFTTGGEDKHSRTFIITEYPDNLGYGWLDDLHSRGLPTNGAHVRLSHHIHPRDQVTTIEEANQSQTKKFASAKEKADKGQHNTQEEYSDAEQLEILKKKLKSNEEKAFDYSLYIEIVAEEEKTLKKASGDLRSKMEEAQVDITPLYDRQNEAKAAAAPLGQDVPKSSQVFDTASLATAFPWVERSVVHPEGTLMGIHEGSGEPLVLNQFRFAGHNALITGKIGSGKSYFAKLINMRRLLSDDDVELLIVDPTGGYQDAVNAFNGQVVDFGDPRLTLNPLEVSKPEEMSATQQVNDEILASKIDNTIDLLAASINNGQPFDMVPENVIRQTARLAYLEKGITDSPETHYKEAPTIGDISNILRNIQAGNKPSEFLELPQEMYEAEVRKAEGGDIPLLSDNSRDQASKLYMGLEPFRDGLYSSFNGQSNVDINNRIVQYDISAITQDNNQAIVQHAVLSNIFERAKASKKRTIIVIDEAHYLIQNERTLGMLNLLVRHSRHYNTGLLIISQTVDEFMNSEKAKEIYDQCDIRALMYHSDIGEQAIDALNLTEGQIQYIKTAQQGDEEGTDYSQSLLDIESIGKKRIRIPSFGLEQHIIDEDKSIWAWLYHQGVVEWDEIPNSEQERARELLIRDFGMEIASS